MKNEPSSPKSCDDLFEDDFPSSGFSLTGVVDAAVDAAVASVDSLEQKPIPNLSPSSSPPAKRKRSDNHYILQPSQIKSEPRTEVSSTSGAEDCSSVNRPLRLMCPGPSESSRSVDEVQNSERPPRVKRPFEQSENSESDKEDNKVRSKRCKERSFSRESTISRESPPHSPHDSTEESRSRNERTGESSFMI